MANAGDGGRSVQSYLDEVPRWPDRTTCAEAPITGMQRRIWALAAAGKFFEGMIVFMTGIALPLIAREFGLGAAQHGLVAAATLGGILVGASLLGGLSDHFGRTRMFVTEMVIFTGFLILVCFSPNFTILIIGLFGLGVALGCDYPTAHLIISETIATRTRGRLVLGAFAFQAVGALFGTAIGYLILANDPTLEAWRLMYASAVVPAIIVIFARLTIPESPHFLAVKGHRERAGASLMRILNRKPAYPQTVTLSEPQAHETEGRWVDLFKGKNRRATILASVPWFLQDLGTYGIGIFTPIILATTFGAKQEHLTSVTQVVENDILAAEGAALIDVLLIVGVVCAVFLSDIVGRMRLQILGFVGCAIGLAVAASSSLVTGSVQTVLIFAGFMIFNFFANIGPNSQTYVVAGEVFPTAVRARGAGFAASCAKLGAVSTAFLFPIILNAVGTNVVLIGLVCTSLLGAFLTHTFRIETAGQDLGTIGMADAAERQGG